jgi:hypothetical protein
VGDAATGINVRGGAGQDTVIGQGFAFTETQKFIMLSSGVETVVDAAGTHTLGAGAGVLLTSARDTLVGGAEDSQVRGTVSTLNAPDSIDMGAGFDELLLYGPGEFSLEALASFSGVDRVRLVNDSGGALVTLRNAMTFEVMGGDGAESYFASHTAGFATRPEFMAGSAVRAGGGADFMNTQSLTVRAGALVDMGDGNDYFGSGAGFVLQGLIDGGAGTDKLELYDNQVDLTDTSHIRNFETYALGNGTYQVNQALVDSRGIVRGTFGGNANLVTAEDALDLRGWAPSSIFTYGSINSQGTEFTVGDAATGINVHGGAGNDTLIADGFAFSEVQLVLLGDNGIERVVDANGIHMFGG